MVSFPNCKINIGLNIINKRPDGFHNLETIFYPVNWKDALEVISNKSAATDISYSHSGLDIPGNTGDNLCAKAYELLKIDFPQLPPVKIHLHKALPMGAGLGGGSADAAFTLKLINENFDLGLNEQQLIDYSLKLGSDCPFFIKNKPCYATGRGEILEEVQLDLSAYKILLVNPGIHINTGWAFGQLALNSKTQNLKELISLPVSEWLGKIENDFERPVFEAQPEIASIKSKMLADGALYAAMSGSGSTLYGIFEKELPGEINFPAHYFYKWV